MLLLLAVLALLACVLLPTSHARVLKVTQHPVTHTLCSCPCLAIAKLLLLMMTCTPSGSSKQPLGALRHMSAACKAS
jgi:hypothetical protein